MLSCRRSFQKHESLLQHAATVHSELNATMLPKQPNLFKCEVPGCGRCFQKLESLRQHVLFHSPTKINTSFKGTKPYKCGVPRCGTSFQDHRALLQHSVCASWASRIDVDADSGTPKATHRAQSSRPSDAQSYKFIPSIPQQRSAPPTHSV